MTTPMGLFPNNSFLGDTGLGGSLGLVPAPLAGDGATKFLKADGTWAVPAGGGGGVTSIANEGTGSGVWDNTTGGVATLRSIKAGANVSVALGGVGNSEIQISAQQNLMWINAPGATVNPMVAGTGYFTTVVGLTTFILPSVAPALGSYFAVAGVSAGGWEIDQNAAQQILYASSPTTVGTGGKVASGSSPHNALTLVYAGVISGNMTWIGVASVGALAFT